MIRPSPPTNPKPAILTLTHIRRGEGAPSALRSPGNDTWLRWRGTPDVSHVFSATACRARCAPGPPCSTASRSCGHRSGPVTRLHGTPWLLAAPLFSCASAAGGLGFRKGGDGGGLLGSRIPPAASAPPVRRHAGLAGPSVLQVRSRSPGDPSITSDLFTPAVSSTLSMSAVVCRSVRFYEL